MSRYVNNELVSTVPLTIAAGSNPSMLDIAFNPSSGVFHAIVNVASLTKWCTLDKSTGVLTEHADYITEVTGDQITVFDFDSAGNMYGMIRANPGFDSLYTIDWAAKTVTPIASTGIGNKSILGITIMNDIVYVVTTDTGGVAPMLLYSVNKTTAAATLIGEIDDPDSVSVSSSGGLTSVNP